MVLPGTPYHGLLDQARFLCHDTGSYFLDATMEDLYQDMPDWSRQTVEELREHWCRAQAANDRFGQFLDWLEGDPEGRLAEVVDFLEGIYGRRRCRRRCRRRS
jgi:phosphoenolpyruvate carboxylase